MSHLTIIAKAIVATKGDIWECGVFQGDTAVKMREFAGPNRALHLFDTFAGMPVSGPHDRHAIGVMTDTSAARVQARFPEDPNTHIHAGIIPATFASFEGAHISVVNIDVDQYQSVRDCLEFIYPRMEVGGYVILDDYGCGDCPGAKLAVDEFMKDKPEKLSTEGSAQPYFIKQ